jgi:hypothetical protein
MATTNIPPAPVRDPWGSYTWEDWFRQIRNRAVESLTTVSWTGIDFTSSNLTNILTRNHNDLSTIQGGTSAEYYHLTSAESVLFSRFNTQEYVTPATGFSNTIGNTTGTYIIEPSGTLATGTLTMPASPVDKQKVTILSTQTITALTHSPNSGQTLKGALTTLAANTSGQWEYKTSNTTWYRTK